LYEPYIKFAVYINAFVFLLPVTGEQKFVFNNKLKPPIEQTISIKIQSSQRRKFPKAHS